MQKKHIAERAPYVDYSGGFRLRAAVASFDRNFGKALIWASVAKAGFEVPNPKLIAEAAVLLEQLRVTGPDLKSYLKRVLQHSTPMNADQINASVSGLDILDQYLNCQYDGQPFVAFTKEYLGRIDYPGFRTVEDGITKLRTMDDYKKAYTPGVAYMCYLVNALQVEIGLLENVLAMGLSEKQQRPIRMRLEMLHEAVRVFRSCTGSIHIPRLSDGAEVMWDIPGKGQVWMRHPILEQTRAFIDSLEGPICLVITDQTAVLGIGNRGPLGGHPVMVGKGKINASAGAFTALPVSIDTTDNNDLIEIITYLASSPKVKAINLEDITGMGARCFEIQKALQKRLSIPIFHDDQDGTAGIFVAGLKTALALQGKSIETAQFVFSGDGAAGNAVVRYLLAAGAKSENILVLDSRGIKSKKRPDLINDPKQNGFYARNKEKIAQLEYVRSNTHGGLAALALQFAGQFDFSDPMSLRKFEKTDFPLVDRGDLVDQESMTGAEILKNIQLADFHTALTGADVFVGMSQANLFPAEYLKLMNNNPIVFSCANPTPEVDNAAAWASRDDIIVATGSSKYANQINNAVFFPGYLLGLMMAGAKCVSMEVALKAADAVLDRIRQLWEAQKISDLNDQRRAIIPAVTDEQVHLMVALATVEAVYDLNINGHVEDPGSVPDMIDAMMAVQRKFGVEAAPRKLIR